MCVQERQATWFFSTFHTNMQTDGERSNRRRTGGQNNGERSNQLVPGAPAGLLVELRTQDAAGHLLQHVLKHCGPPFSPNPCSLWRCGVSGRFLHEAVSEASPPSVSHEG
eukprot:TRINITY_DN7420_c0_g1_i1.p1 TRINITY_DN7420_c0_g1~~TRINITY_DN7420_c0_g1_i1.p1  ORF type:complete len:110 (+),score=8.55 TRINITY_DN7420_c0_g1_i1:247-576(+)